MAADVLALEGVTKQYGQGELAVPVLHGVSLSVAAGEMVALLGQSGSGKTTLLQIAGGLDRPSGGAVLWEGKRIDQLSDAARTRRRGARIGFVYQSHHLLPEFTARENVMLPQQILGIGEAEAAKRADALLARLGLEHRGHHYPSQLSGGQQQRVAIARALANRPALLFADEPTGNLDPTTAQEVFALLRELAAEEGLAALVATHNHDLAQALDRSLMLDGGRL